MIQIAGLKSTDYTSAMSSQGDNKKSDRADNEDKAKQYDSVEISDAGQKASYDMSKIMRIHDDSKKQIPGKADSDYYWNARANDKALDQSLYDMDKAEALQFVGQVQSILMKAVSGQKLTSEEQQMVDSDPALAQEIETRKAEAASGKI